MIMEKEIRLTVKAPVECTGEQFQEGAESCLGTVVCSSCSSIINPEDKKHCFWDEDVEQGTQLICFECYMEYENIIRDFGF